ncbi:MAG: hypothetical protein RLZZ229_72 [Actinomycetota bacterium]|jgi:D-alanyl-D-alanine carboxypeptidase
MFQPKRQNSSSTPNRFGALSISAAAILVLVVGVLAGPGYATTDATDTSDATDKVAYSITKASSLWVVANKQRPLVPLAYKPKLASNINLAAVAAPSYALMKAAMKKAGAGTLILNSGYRSYNTQVIVHANQVARLGLKAGEALAARPGHSEHQTGLAADVSASGQGCSIQVCFAKTKAGKWLAANSWQYGFVLRYPDRQTKITGYQFEPWHFRYVGVQLATEMKSQNIATLEKFWKLPAAPSYSY